MDDYFDDEIQTILERIVGRDLDVESGRGKPLSSRARQTQRSIEAYLKAGVRPRWMERVVEVDQGIAAERRRLDRAYRALLAEARSSKSFRAVVKASAARVLALQASLG